MLKGKNILILGGAGFIGSHLVEAVFKESPKWLYVIDNLSVGKMDNLKSVEGKFLMHQINAANYVELKKVFGTTTFDYVFNLAVTPLPESLIEPKHVVDTNIAIVSNLCELQRQGFLKTLIHFSSSEVYGSGKILPIPESHAYGNHTPYAASKQAGDQICLSYVATFGSDIRIIRPFNNYGPRQNDKRYAAIIPITIRRLQRGSRVTIFGDGEQTRDFIYVKDTVRAAIDIALAPKCKGKVINIGTGKETSIYSLVKSLLTLYHKRKELISFESDRIADVRRHCADISLAKSFIGFKPHYSLKEGLKETVKWYDKNQ